MTLRSYKFLVVAVVQNVDDEGNVTGESHYAQKDGQPIVIFGTDALAKWAQDFPAKLASAQPPE